MHAPTYGGRLMVLQTALRLTVNSLIKLNKTQFHIQVIIKVHKKKHDVCRACIVAS